MKSTKLFLLLSIISTLTIVGCKKGIPENFDYGTIENHVYKNDFFGMTMNLPSDWDVQSTQEKKDIIEFGRQEVNSKELDKQIKLAEISSAHLLMVSQFDVATYTNLEVLNSNFSLIAENVSSSNIKSAKSYLDLARVGIAKSGAQIVLEDSTESMDVNGQTFYYFDGVMTMRGVQINQRYMSTIINGFSLNFVATYGSEEQLNTLMDILKTSSFN